MQPTTALSVSREGALAGRIVLPYTGQRGSELKTAITVRVDAALLIEARRCARLENRTLTNFIETLLQRRVTELTSRSVQDGAGTQTPPKNDAPA